MKVRIPNSTFILNSVHETFSWLNIKKNKVTWLLCFKCWKLANVALLLNRYISCLVNFLGLFWAFLVFATGQADLNYGFGLS